MPCLHKSFNVLFTKAAGSWFNTSFLYAPFAQSTVRYKMALVTGLRNLTSLHDNKIMPRLTCLASYPVSIDKVTSVSICCYRLVRPSFYGYTPYKHQ
jgi:hypothetical protein